MQLPWRAARWHVAALASVILSAQSSTAYTPEPASAPGAVTQVTARLSPPQATVTTIAGVPEDCTRSSDDNGKGKKARFCSPKSGAVDSAGNFYLSDSVSNRIRKVTPAGVVTTVAGDGAEGYFDGRGKNARFYNPSGLVINKAGDIFVADTLNCAIRRITPAGIVNTVLGRPGICRDVDGPPETARFDAPTGITLHPDGTLYVTSYMGCTVRKIALDGTVTTVAGAYKECGEVDGPAKTARVTRPAGLVFDSTGNLLWADEDGGCVIRKLSPDGIVSTLAGSPGVCDFADGKGSAAKFNVPSWIGVDHNDNLYVTDWLNHVLRRVTPAGDVTTIAGSPGRNGFADGTGSGAKMYRPDGMAIDANDEIYFTDRWNKLIRKAVLGKSMSVDVTFAAPAVDGGGPITGYTVESSPAGGVDRNAGSVSLTHVIEGLTPGTAYTFIVRAANTAGPGPASVPSNSVSIPAAR